MTAINHFYRCFGCGKRHDAKAEAITCCAVVQEVFECSKCRTVFPTRANAVSHLYDEHQDNEFDERGNFQAVEDFAIGQSFAAGASNFNAY